jgi:hypothetical protein
VLGSRNGNRIDLLDAGSKGSASRILGMDINEDAALTKLILKILLLR